MISDIFRSEVMGIVEKFNQSEFDRDDSYYFVRFSNDYVYIDRCSKGRIELFSRFIYNGKTNSLLIETLNTANDKFMEFIKNSNYLDSLEQQLQSLMQYGIQDI